MKKLMVIVFLTLGSSLLTLCSAQYNVLLNFDGTDGQYPAGSLTLSGHTLFGMTQWGGAIRAGNIFSIDTNGGNYKNLFQFGNGYPFGDLTLSGHKLYGLTYWGGTGKGNAFSIDTNGSGFENLHSFNDTDGQYPTGSFILSGSTLYAMTEEGGDSNSGVVFSMDTNGTGFKDLLDFCPSKGTFLQGSLLLSGHKLYGMTNRGGAYDSGVVFSMDTNGNGYKDLLDFNGPNGKGAPSASPSGSLIISGKRLYGMTYGGGLNHHGCIFSLDTNGSGYNKILDFNDTNGATPFGSLILSGKTLYGASIDNIFSIDTDGHSYKLLQIINSPNGWFVSGSLILAKHTLYGMAYAGGKYNSGIIYSYNLCNPLTIVDSIVPDSGTCTGVATVNVTSGGNAPYTYLWTSGGQTTATITGQCAGTYCCIITNENGCPQTECVTINSLTGINTISSNENKITIYPNPGNGIFTFQSSVVSGKCSVEVYNVLGEKVYDATLNQDQGDNTVNLSNQPNGIYLYRVITDNRDLAGEGKLIIQK